MDNATSCLVYKQTILPYFDYVSLIAESSTKRKIGKFQPLQNRAVKIILKRNEYVSTEDMKLLHNQLRLSLLCTRRRKFMLKLIFKLSKSEENVELYRPDIRLRGREKVRMHKPYSNKERVLKSPYYLAVNLWNQLDEEMQTIQNRFDFKKRLNFVDVDSLKIGTER